MTSVRRLALAAVTALVLAAAAPGGAFADAKCPDSPGSDPAVSCIMGIPTLTDHDFVVATFVKGAGVPVSAWIEYGTDTTYGNSTAAQSTAAGASDHFVWTIGDGSALTPNTTYHLRLVTQPDGGAVAHGEDYSIMTADAPATNLLPPQIVGNATAGQTLVCDPGTWNRPVTYDFEWLRDGVQVSAAGPAFTLADGDAGSTIQCGVKGTDSHTTSAYALSAAVAVGPRSAPVGAKSIACVVPTLSGRTLAAARALLSRAECHLGKIAHAWSSRVKKGRVIRNSPTSGGSFAAGHRIAVTVSKGKRPAS